jgi:hypothetical protein
MSTGVWHVNPSQLNATAGIIIRLSNITLTLLLWPHVVGAGGEVRRCQVGRIGYSKALRRP